MTYERQIEPEFPADTVLALLTARPEVIRARMAAAPHRHSVVPPADVEAVQQQFEAAYTASWVRRKVRLNTSELARLTRYSTGSSAVVRPRLDVRDLLLLDSR